MSDGDGGGWSAAPVPADDIPASTIFSTPPSRYTHNLLIVDTHFKSPPICGVGIPGPDLGEYESELRGLSGVRPDVLAELPPECRAAFEEAKGKELAWKSSWRTEAEDAARGKLRIGF